MKYELPNEEREYLRDLAKHQAEIAALPIMEVRKKMWTDMNDGVPGTRPPFALETGSFGRDFMPKSLFRCNSQYGQRWEYTFLQNIRHQQLLQDDHVCPDTIDIGWHVWSDPYGIEIPTEHSVDSEGETLGYHFECPITDLDDGYDMVKPATFGVNREETMQEKAFVQDLFGDIMPVVMRSGVYANNYLTQSLMRLMSMETFFVAMHESPDQLHGILSLLRDNALRMARWSEEEGLLEINNGNQCTCGTCYNFTTLLPGEDYKPAKVTLKQMWAGMDSQETVGVSPDLFHEFCFPYYRDLAELYGLVYWGCCELVDPIWERSISKLPNLHAVSISRWANEEFMAEALNGTGVVYSRKPNPNLLSLDVTLDEDAWCKEIRTSLQALAGKAVNAEFIVRDVYTLHGNINNAIRATKLAHQEIDKFFT